MLRDISKGVGGRGVARSLREYGGYAIPFVLITDAMSVYAAVSATNINTSADKSVLSHEHKYLGRQAQGDHMAGRARYDCRRSYKRGRWRERYSML